VYRRQLLAAGFSGIAITPTAWHGSILCSVIVQAVRGY